MPGREHQVAGPCARRTRFGKGRWPTVEHPQDVPRPAAPDALDSRKRVSSRSCRYRRLGGHSEVVRLCMRLCTSEMRVSAALH